MKIHLLWEGRTLCGEHAGLVPRDWPGDDRWIRADTPRAEIDALIAEHAPRGTVLCVGCLGMLPPAP